MSLQRWRIVVCLIFGDAVMMQHRAQLVMRLAVEKTVVVEVETA